MKGIFATALVFLATAISAAPTPTVVEDSTRTVVARTTALHIGGVIIQLFDNSGAAKDNVIIKVPTSDGRTFQVSSILSTEHQDFKATDATMVNRHPSLTCFFERPGNVAFQITKVQMGLNNEVPKVNFGDFLGKKGDAVPMKNLEITCTVSESKISDANTNPFSLDLAT
jgi:hypothetical protein